MSEPFMVTFRSPHHLVAGDWIKLSGSDGKPRTHRVIETTATRLIAQRVGILSIIGASLLHYPLWAWRVVTYPVRNWWEARHG